MTTENKRLRLDKNDSKLEADTVVSKGPVYMDYNATTPLATSVINIITETLHTGWGNPSSSYSDGLKAKEIIETSRKNINTMLNGKYTTEISFMSGGTEANNHVIWNAMMYYKKWLKANETPIELEKPHIITSVIEHDSILCVLKRLEEEGEANVSYVEVSRELGYVDPKDVLREVRNETVLVTIMMANNETGVVQPIAEICNGIKKLTSTTRQHLPSILLHTDAAQAIGKLKVDVQELHIDYLTVVGHKFYGPRIGALWVRDSCPFYPMLLGGGQEKGKRAGTENTCMIAGLGEAAALVSQHLTEYQEHFQEIRSYLKQQLTNTFQDAVTVKYNCFTPTNLANTLNTSFMGSNMGGKAILNNCKYTEASVGAACHTHTGDKPSSILLMHYVQYSQALNAVRLSVGRETTKDDIDVVVHDLKNAIERHSST